MDHQMSTTTTVNDEYVLKCTCGVQFIGTAEGVQRNQEFHQNEVRPTFTPADCCIVCYAHAPRHCATCHHQEG